MFSVDLRIKLPVKPRNERQREKNLQLLALFTNSVEQFLSSLPLRRSGF